MAIKVYRGSAGVSAAPGGAGLAGWFRAFSPGNRMRLVRVQIMFNSYDEVTNEWDNPINDRLNYFNTQLDNTGLTAPYLTMNSSIVGGVFDDTPTFFFNTPGVYDVDLTFTEEIWMAFFSYNYAAVNNHYHYMNVLFTVDETPLNQ